MRGAHYIKSWASTQKNITLSSGEAELVAAVKASTELIGVIQLAAEWGRRIGGAVYVDSSAALGVVHRRGNGKMRHVKVGQLWIQEQAEEGSLAYRKVRGDTNPSDMLTKYVSRPLLERHTAAVGFAPREGRAELGLQLGALFA